jgi:enoyl-CoA hydratase
VPSEPALVEERRDGVLVLTINRPRRRNAINREVAESLARALDLLDTDPELRVGVLTGAEGTFSSGMDLKEFGEGRTPVIEGRGFAGFVEAPPAKPLIAAVEGHALAGGFEVALACDLIVASREASLGLPEPRRGLLAAGGGLLRLPRVAPLNVAREMILTGEPINGQRAAELGLVSRVCEPGGALAAATEIALTIAANGPLAVAAAKRVLAMGGELPESEFWARQAVIFEQIMASADAAEGAVAFVEKRAPRWSGS